MADTRPTPVSVLRAVRLCLMFLFHPARFIEEENRDVQLRQSRTDGPQEICRAHVVRRAFGLSFLLVALATLIGFLSGRIVSVIACPSAKVVLPLQVFGAGLLLWGTLFIRGWEIQTFSGVTLTERVNQWLYRFLYFAGTVLFVCSLAI